MPLDEFTKWMRDDIELLPQAPNILNVNILGSQRKKFGLQYCPECLSQSSYFKSEWRLAILPACINKVLLNNRCPHCLEPIYLTKTTSVLRNLSSCPLCWKSLIVPAQQISNESLKFIQAIETSIATGWFKYDQINVYAPLFFKGFWRVIYAFYGTKGKKKNTWKKTCSFFDLPYTELSNIRLYNSFKDETPAHRLKIITVVQKMLNDWPSIMIESSKHSGITQIVLNLTRSGLPYWLQLIAEQELNKKQYNISIEEFCSALAYLNRRKLPITKSGIAKLLAQDKSRKLNNNETKIFDLYSSKRNS